MLEYITFYFQGAVIIASVLMLWFETNIGIHILHLCRNLGFRKTDSEFWGTELPMSLWTQEDLKLWKLRNLPPLWDELITCPKCLSVHLSVWLSSFFVVIFIIQNLNINKFIFLITTSAGWPYLSNYLYNKIKQIEL